MACVHARTSGQPLPMRRPPCFFNPAHGPSTTDVEWAPPGGQQRQIPVCAADADRVAQGAEPDIRTVQQGVGRVPYWQGGPAYSPWASGYFGGYAASGLLPSFLLLTMLSPTWDGVGGDGFDSGGDGDGGYDGGDSGDSGDGVTPAAGTAAATTAGRRGRRRRRAGASVTAAASGTVAASTGAASTSDRRRSPYADPPVGSCAPGPSAVRRPGAFYVALARRTPLWKVLRQR